MAIATQAQPEQTPDNPFRSLRGRIETAIARATEAAKTPTPRLQ